MDDAARVGGNLRLVSDDDDGFALFVQPPEDRHDLFPLVSGQIPGGLVAQYDGGVIDERAGDGDPLLLTTGELGGTMLHAVSKADGLERSLGARPALPVVR